MFSIDYLDEKHLAVTFPYSPSLVSTIQKLPDRVFDKKSRVWKMPVLDLFILIKILKDDGYGANITKKAKAHYLETISKYEQDAELAKLEDVDYSPRAVNVQLYRFQKVAVSYLNKVENAGGKILKQKSKISEEQNIGFWALITNTEGNNVALHSMG